MRQAKQPSSSAKRAVGKGFFAVLALCLLAVGGTAAITFSDTLGTPTTRDTPSETATTTALAAGRITAPPTATVTLTTTVTTAVKTTTTTTATTDGTPLFVLPLTNTVLCTYSEQPVYNDTLASYRIHPAVDFKGEDGMTVRVLTDGTVQDVSDDPLWGPSVTVDHGGGIVSVYRGVQADVAVGDVLKGGEAIGILTAIPCEKHLGMHLHLELYRNGEPVDVTTLLKTQLNYP